MTRKKSCDNAGARVAPPCREGGASESYVYTAVCWGRAARAAVCFRYSGENSDVQAANEIIQKTVALSKVILYNA